MTGSFPASVAVKDEWGSWAQMKLADGAKGWMSRDYFTLTTGMVVPSGPRRPSI